MIYAFFTYVSGLMKSPTLNRPPFEANWAPQLVPLTLLIIFWGIFLSKQQRQQQRVGGGGGGKYSELPQNRNP